MSTEIQDRLSKLFTAVNATSTGGRVVKESDRYIIYSGPTWTDGLKFGGVYEALQKVGLIDNSKDIEFDYPSVSVNGKVSGLGSNVDGTFCDRVALSDNAFALAKIGEDYSFEITFGTRSEQTVVDSIDEAIRGFLQIECQNPKYRLLKHAK